MKTEIIIILILIIFYLSSNPSIISNLTKSLENITISSQDNSIFNNIISPLNININSCESWLETKIPSSISLIVENYPKSYFLSSYKEDIYWKDGVKISNNILVQYKPGSLENQNINYYYPENAVYDYDELLYSKQITDSSGYILGYNTFSVKLILKPILGTERKTLDKVGWEYTKADFEVIDYEIISCNLVQDDSNLNQFENDKITTSNIENNIELITDSEYENMCQEICPLYCKTLISSSYTSSTKMCNCNCAELPDHGVYMPGYIQSLNDPSAPTIEDDLCSTYCSQHGYMQSSRYNDTDQLCYCNDMSTGFSMD